MNALEVVLTATHDGKPLAIVKNLPGLDAEMRPERLRELAAALLAAADDCEPRPTTRRDACSRS